MEKQNISNQNNIEKPKRKYWKFVAGFFAVIIGIFVLANVGIWLWQKYDLWQGQKRVQNLAEALKKAEQEDYKRAMADTYGGKTPQETLQMYIDAVEKGDYELASKYFIGDNQEEELKRLKSGAAIASKEMINTYIKTLKLVLDKKGKYALDGKYFSFNGEILVRMKLYPNGIWKIIEI